MSAPPTTQLAFIDVETTGLDPLAHEVCEVGVVIPDPQRPEPLEEASFLIDLPPLTLAAASDEALRINRYRERALVAIGAGLLVSPWSAASRVAALIEGRHLANWNVAFDATFLRAWFARWLRRAPAWKTRLLDLGSFAHGAGVIDPSQRFDDLLAALAITPAADERHTALGDARLAARAYLEILQGRAP